MTVSLCVGYPSLFYLTEPGCNIRSGDRELCRLDLTAPFVNPGNCPLECYYDDMIMSQLSFTIARDVLGVLRDSKKKNFSNKNTTKMIL